ncbi:uncharacterized protein LOC113338926 [Papaver somniferum]|uniref:uncharacterized protein LOC113338926 n=1 Tax=Papaver somniferum TaxID=3469 RepID=UPI000E6F50AE|nr:uncharacterized protein LOC113338926 [Papaver somniferum]
MFSSTCQVLLNVIQGGTKASQRSLAYGAYENMTTFDFVFILHVMKKTMEITDLLSQALQYQSQDIVNAINIDVPDFNSNYVPLIRGVGARHHSSTFTIMEHYRVDIFNAAIDAQLSELISRFNEETMELLILSRALDPREGKKSFKVDDICRLVNKFYPKDFTEQEKLHLKIQLRHYEHNVVSSEEFKKLRNISSLCEWLAKNGKSTTYSLIHRVIELVLTLPVSTATEERVFSAMKIIKTRLRSKMGDEFLGDSLIVLIEKEIAKKFSIDSMIDDFRDLKERRVMF